SEPVVVVTPRPRRSTPTPTTAPKPTRARPPTKVPTPTPTLSAVPTPTPLPVERPQEGADLYSQLRAEFNVPGKQVDPVAAWRFGGLRAVSSAASLYEGTLYFGTDAGRFYAVDARTGLEQWRYQVGGPITSAPDVTEDLVYFGSDDGNVYALERRTGRLIWRDQFESEVRAPITVADGLVYAASGGDLYALDARSSKQRWRIASYYRVNGRPVLAGKTLVYSTDDGVLNGVDARTGSRRWRSYLVGSSPYCSPAIAAGTIYAGATNGYLTAVDARNGHVQWQERIGRGPVSSPAVDGKLVVAVAQDGRRARVSALDTSSGKRRWSVLLPASSVSSPALVDGVVYVGAKDGSLYTLAAKDGKGRWRFATGSAKAVDAGPLVASGRVYFGSRDGYMYAVGSPRAVSGKLPEVGHAATRRDRRGDATNHLALNDIVVAGARYAEYEGFAGVALEMQLAGPPPSRTKRQVAYVWAIDTTLDSDVDFYVFVDIVPGAKQYRGTLERPTLAGLVTVNDRIPFQLSGERTIRAFLPFEPHLSTGGVTPTIQLYAYTNREKLPVQDDLTADGRYFSLQPGP
ncbi:MAG: PQQ-binding-like beta-propeller repeat protein, partial [Chloroflexota bacterium]|nr:PQQ-binding-like beta-propeller repeat protein [Chloroflexota bacterium]